MANITINGLTNKASPVGTDEIEIQETSNGPSYKTTLAAAMRYGLTKRVQSAGTLSNPFTPNIDSYDTIYFTGCVDNTPINAPSGTPYDGQTLSFIGYLPATRYLAYNAIFVSGAGLLQSEFLANKYCTVTFQYISAISKWVQIYRGQGA